MRTKPVNAHREHGASTLATGLALLAAITVLSLAFHQIQGTEQRIARSTLRGNEALAAAEAGLAFGHSWLSQHRPVWIATRHDSQVSTPAGAMPGLRDSQGRAFVMNIAFQRSRLRPSFVLIRSDAQPGDGRGRASVVQAYVRPHTVLSASGETAPPLVVGGCVAAVTGRPDIYPLNAHAPDTGAGIAHGPAECPATSAIDLHGGYVAGNAFPSGKTWPYMFRVTREELQSLAREEADRLPPRDRRYWWATARDLTGGKWRRSLGTPENPVVLIFPKALACPELATGAVIHGVVYVEGHCNNPGGGAAARIYGILAVEGNLAVFSQNLRLAHISHASGAPDELRLPVTGAPMIPGTWKDF